MSQNKLNYKLTIIGGAGHIGLPLGLLFAEKGIKVNLYDKNLYAIKKINNSELPFVEENGVKLLKKNKKKIFATSNKNCISKSNVLIVCIGTPVKNNKPDLIFFFKLFKEIKNLLNPNQLIIIRSSIYPGTCKKIYQFLGKNFTNISYCPERVVQGKSISELPKLPQVISGISSSAINKSKNLFSLICKKTIVTSILEAELIKLFSNAWRYINFSISNEFYMACENFNIKFDRLRKIMIDGYERNKNIPTAGFAAGPCLYKDTMQLNSFLKQSFSLGKVSTKINQKLPYFIYKQLLNKFKNNLKYKKIGILGITFKADIDDIRDSLALELFNLLKRKKLKVIFSDNYNLTLKKNLNQKKLISKSDIIIIGAPHKVYKTIKIPKNKYLIDIWGFIEK
jgi:UDP-N-acetyl-D-mannosaminuronic acid dehydrogenase